MAKQTLKLVDILKTELKKTDSEKALAAVERTVRTARTNAVVELSQAQTRAEDAQDRYEAAIKAPSTTLATLVNLQREVQLANADLAVMQEIMEARF